MFQALSVFKKLHHARRIIFSGDPQALEAARNKINSEFRERATLTNPSDIEKVTVLVLYFIYCNLYWPHVA